MASQVNTYHAWVAHCRVRVGVSVVDRHVLKEPTNVLFKEAFNFSIVELGVYEYCPNIRFYDIWKTLSHVLARNSTINNME